MDTERKHLGLYERSLIRESLQHWRQKEVSWLMETFGDIDHTIICLGNMSDRGQVIKLSHQGVLQGIVAFDVGYTWWTPHRVCTELLVLAFKDVHGFQMHAIKALEDVARDYGAKLIVTGNMFQKNNNLIGNGYKKHGFRQECSTYVREVMT